MPIKLEREWLVPDADRKTTDRGDYTTDVITNVDVTVQRDRLAAVIESSIEAILAGVSNAYNSGWLETGDFTRIRGGIYSDKNCTIYIEQSDDGTTLIVQTSQTYTGKDYDGGFIEDIVMPYVRLRVVAATDTTTFRVWNRLSN